MINTWSSASKRILSFLVIEIKLKAIFLVLYSLVLWNTNTVLCILNILFARIRNIFIQIYRIYIRILKNLFTIYSLFFNPLSAMDDYMHSAKVIGVDYGRIYASIYSILYILQSQLSVYEMNTCAFLNNNISPL